MSPGRPGSPVFSTEGGGLEPGLKDELDRAVADVSFAAPRWARLPLGSRISLLDRLLADCGGLVPVAAAAALLARVVTQTSQHAGEGQRIPHRG